MAQARIDPSEPIPEADLLEQQVPIEPSLTDDEPMQVASEAPIEPVDEADRWEQQVPCPQPTATTRIPSRVVVMADPLVEVAVRVYADFADRATLAEVLAVVDRARNDLDAPSAAALPELVDRLARQRLAEHLASPATSNGSTREEHGGEPHW